jgi:hypothetical protein
VLSSPTPDQVRSLAPDPGAARAGEGLASRRHWSATGRNDRAAWGLCQGSGANPYQVTVDFGGPAFKCTCPSRKFPCKHGLGLMFLLAGDAAAFPAAPEPPGWAVEWLAARSAKAESAAAKAEASSAPETGEATRDAAADAADAEAARSKRIAARERKVDAGLADLDLWLVDLVRRGLLAARGEGYAFWDQAGARLVDAQAASLGREVRGIGAAANRGSGWAEGTLERVARVHLIREAYRRQDVLPDDLRADVRALVGWTTKEDELPGGGDVIDRWLAVGRTVTSDERLTTARTWLLGEATGQYALHLAFGAGGTNPVPVAMAGSSFRGAIRFYPSAVPLRAVVADGALDPGGPITALPGGLTIAAAATAFAETLARNPFVTSWPTILRDVVPIGRGGELLLRDATGAAIRSTPPAIAARLVALAGGHPVTVFGLWSGRSIRVLSAHADGRLVDLGTEVGGDDDEVAIEPVPVRGQPGSAGGGDPWGRLVSAALLGTERGEPEPLALPEPVAAISGRPTESRFLATAAVVAATRRAGWVPDLDTGDLPSPAAADPRPAVGPQAGWLLRRALDERPELIPEWLALARVADRRPPDDELPRLLALSARHHVVRDELVPLVGPRARWLVGQLPELAAGIVGHGPSAEHDPAEAWTAAVGAADRAGVVARLRARDPGAGRALLDAMWEDASFIERALAIETLADGLSAADEPLLERAWTDSRAEVRAPAMDLLARVPDSGYARLADAVGRPLLAIAGRLRPSLEVHAPAEWTTDLAGLGIPRKPPQGTGERAWWLRHAIARVAPPRWEEWLGADPGTLLDRATHTDEASALILGWIEAADGHRDAAWSAAILERPSLLGREEVQAVDPFRLLAHLAPRERDTAAVALIGVADAEIARRVADVVPGPWSDSVAAAVTTAVARNAGTIGWSVPAPVRELARMAARRCPPGAVAELERVLGELGQLAGGGTTGLTDIFDTLRFRVQLAAAFATETHRR